MPPKAKNEAPARLEIPIKLTTENYAAWAFQMQSLLSSYQLLEKDDEDILVEPFKVIDHPDAQRAIVMNVTEPVLKTLLFKKTACEMWDFLYETNSGENRSRMFAGIKKLAGIKFGKGDMQGNLQELETLVAATETAAGSSSIMIKDLAIAMFLDALPDRYNSARSAMEINATALDAVATFTDMRKILLAEEQRQENRGEQTAGFAGSAKQSTTCKHGRVVDDKNPCWNCNPELHPSKRICADCKGTGHGSRRSPKCGLNNGHGGAAPNGFGGLAAHFSGSGQTDNEDWPPMLPNFAGVASNKRRQTVVTFDVGTKHKKQNFGKDDLRHSIVGKQTANVTRKVAIDSGCSQTLMSNKETIQNYSTANVLMNVANDSSMHCPGQGDVALSTDLKLSNVLHCPDVALNLLSVSQLCDRGLIVRFDKEHAIVHKKGKPNDVVLRAHREDGLYTFKLPAPASSKALATTKSTHRSVLQHRRMGHLNYQSLRLLSNLSDGMVLDSTPDHLCVPCTQAKAHRNPFPSSKSQAPHVGYLVHTDVCYIGIPTITGDFTMFILFIDDYSRYTTVFLLRTKADAADAFIQYEKKMFNMTTRHISILRSDGGTEFFRHSLRDYCSEHGITHQSSTPYTPQHNGRAERPNRTVVEGASAMLLDSKLPWEYWGYAVQTFVYLKNRSPHASLYQATPFEQWYKKVPDLTHLRVFGCKCFVLVPQERRTGPGSKLLAKAEQMLFVGYSDIHKAYKCFNETTLCEVFSPHVTFDERSSSRSIEYPNTFAEHLAPIGQSAVQSSSNENVLINDAVITEVETEAVAHSDVEQEHIHPEVNNNSDDDEKEDYDPLVSYMVQPELTAFMSMPPVDSNPSYEEAMRGANATEFDAAIKKEYRSLAENNVFSAPMDLPYGKRALGTVLVLKIKESESEDIPRKFKARLCGQGYRQQYGTDFNETYAPVAAYNSVRMFISLVASMDFEIDSVDVITAFLLADLEEEIYVKIPDGYPKSPGNIGKVLRLLKSLYGLKQAPKAWNDALDKYLKSIGFEPLVSDACVYVGKWEGIVVYILIYVDDMLIAASNRAIMAQVKAKIHSRFPITDNGPLSFWLNMHFIRDREKRTVAIHQEPKIAKLLMDERYSPEERLKVIKPCKIPASPDKTLTKDMSPTDDKERARMANVPYKSVVGQLLYISITARPDISTAVSSCGRYSHNPGQEHWDAVLQIVAYLSGTRKLRLILGGCKKVELSANLKLSAASDSDWAGDKDKRYSRTGYVIYMGTAAVVWCSKLQKSVALSSTEAEYIALTATARDLIWCRALLEEMGFTMKEASIIHEDNDSASKIAQSYKKHPGVKHIEIRQHFIRDRVLEVKDIAIERLSTYNMVADLLTKQLPFPAFARHRQALGLAYA